MDATATAGTKSQGLSSLNDTIRKFKADEDRHLGGPGLLGPKSWVYVDDPHPLGPSLVQVDVGPIIGTVTHASIVVLLEVDISAMVTLIIARRGADEAPRRFQRRMPAGRPVAFHAEGLEPASLYDISFEGLASFEDVRCTARTLPLPTELRRLTVFALAGDQPRTMDGGEVAYNAEEPLLFLHLGEQIYANLRGYLRRALHMMKGHEQAPPNLAAKMCVRALEKLQEAYRDTWSDEKIRELFTQGQRMLLWSENDIAEGFATRTGADGKQAYPAEFLKLAMKCYRMYQRQLSDPVGEGALPQAGQPMEEWQFRTFGTLGVFLVDIRGNSISSTGEVLHGPLMSERQKSALSGALDMPELMGLIVASELPFVGDPPKELVKRVAKEPDLAFMKKSWPYNSAELDWLLEAIFDWREKRPGREVIMIGAGVCCGAESLIHDNKTAATIHHITLAPLTNQPRPFCSKRLGEIGSRFTYRHEPLAPYRNYCRLDVTIGEDGICQFSGELIGAEADRSANHQDKAPPPTFEGLRFWSTAEKASDRHDRRK